MAKPKFYPYPLDHISNVSDVITDLIAQLESFAKDKERLDWLEANRRWIGALKPRTFDRETWHLVHSNLEEVVGETVREAIDKAMDEDQ